jgi:ATP-dependent Clp protease ATP-binding subunit ClpC
LVNIGAEVSHIYFMINEKHLNLMYIVIPYIVMNVLTTSNIFACIDKLKYRANKCITKGTTHVVAGDVDKAFLEKYTINLTQIAKKNKFHPIIGRSNEMDMMYNVLLKRGKRNPLLVGDAGVGKTSLVEELARRIAHDTNMHHDLDSDVLQLDIAGLMSGTQMRGELEERVTKLLGIITNTDADRNIILFIDEIHSIVQASGGNSVKGEINICDLFKPLLARGKLQCIGATTREEYIKFFKNDPAFDRRFKYIEVDEPSETATLLIMEGIKPVYENYHNCYITNEALRLSVSLSQQYIPYRNFPDKAIDLIDEACSKVVLEHYKTNSLKIVDVVDIYSVMGMIINLEMSHISISTRGKIQGIKEELESKIIGQEYAISIIVKTLSRHCCGMYSTKRPICSMLFIGPTGVGKTELTKLLTKGYYGRSSNLLRFDMSEYMENFSVSTLIGSPPGYEGYREGGELTTAIKEHPCSVVLFDEIEKAHPDVLNLLLQILEDGILTDASGRGYSFRNAIIVMTSNVTGMSDNRSFGFVPTTNTCTDVARGGVLSASFRPEFLNRIDEIVDFQSLNENHLHAICEVCLYSALQRVPNDINVTISDVTKRHIVERALLETEYGARPIKRLIEELVVDKLTNFLLRRSDETKEICI